MCVWQELPGYDTDYTETDRKDIQNLAQEIETKYDQYELRKTIEYENDETLPSCCLAMCLDWCLDKLLCRSGNQEDDMYMPNN